MTHEKENIKARLHESALTVVFNKKDGTQRTMLCTLKPELLPALEKKEDSTDKKEKKQSEESIAVWDLEKKAWRSFRFDSIISFTAAE